MQLESVFSVVLYVYDMGWGLRGARKEFAFFVSDGRGNEGDILGKEGRRRHTTRYEDVWRLRQRISEALSP
jgi:hypothetical protein